MIKEQYFDLENNLYTYTDEDTPNCHIFFSTRNGGTSTGAYESNNLALHVGDDDNAVIENRKLHAKALNHQLEDFIFTEQTHSDNIYHVTSERNIGTLSMDDTIKNTDGLYTFEDDVVLNAFVADCTPVYFYSKADHLVGVLHCGWQGTVKGLTYKALNEVCQKHNLDINNFKVVIGPSIAQENFEVGQDVIDLVNNLDYIDYASTYTVKNDEKYLLDVKKINYLQAMAAGVKPENIKVTDLDTFDNDNFFSFRKENVCGRLCASIYQTNN